LVNGKTNNFGDSSSNMEMIIYRQYNQIFMLIIQQKKKEGIKKKFSFRKQTLLHPILNKNFNYPMGWPKIKTHSLYRIDTLAL